MYKLDVDGFRPDKGGNHLKSKAHRLPAHHAAIRLASPDGSPCDDVACTGSKIFAFYRGGTMVYDSEMSTVVKCPRLLAPKNDFLTVGHDIYALHTRETTDKGRMAMKKLGPAPRRAHGEWLWENLPPPPMKWPGGYVKSYALHPSGSFLFLSLSNRGTFYCHTGFFFWIRLGDWFLPFQAEEVLRLKT